jgi:hypothetical protein
VAKSFFSDEECRQAGFSGPMIATLRKLADFVDLVEQQQALDEAVTLIDTAVTALEESQEDQNLSLASLDGRIDVFEDFSATDPRYAKKAGDTFTGAVDVQALLQCDSFRLDSAPSVSAATASTHKVGISCNGVNYFVLLSDV